VTVLCQCFLSAFIRCGPINRKQGFARLFQILAYRDCLGFITANEQNLCRLCSWGHVLPLINMKECCQAGSMLDPTRVGWKVITTSTGLLMLVYHIGTGLSQQKFCRSRSRNIGQGSSIVAKLGIEYMVTRWPG
jgi:hypothetical protein